KRVLIRPESVRGETPAGRPLRRAPFRAEPGRAKTGIATARSAPRPRGRRSPEFRRGATSTKPRTAYGDPSGLRVSGAVRGPDAALWERVPRPSAPPSATRSATRSRQRAGRPRQYGRRAARQTDRKSAE